MTGFLGGWTLLTNYTITDGVYRSITDYDTDDIEEIVTSNFTKYISKTGTSNLFDYMNFIEIRWYCTADVPGRTIHLRFLPNPDQDNIIRYIKSTSGIVPRIKRAALYADDNAILSRDRGNWGYHREDCGVGCGYRYYQEYIFGDYRYSLTYTLYRYPLNIYRKERWEVYNDKLICDDEEHPFNLKYGTWQVYVR